MIQVKKSITLMRPRAEVYRFWRQLERLPSFLIHLRSVTEISKTRSHWAANGPGGAHIEWDVEERIERGEIDPTMVITHRMPLADAAKGYDIFLNKEDHCEKVVLKAN